MLHTLVSMIFLSVRIQKDGRAENIVSDEKCEVGAGDQTKMSVCRWTFARHLGHLESRFPLREALQVLQKQCPQGVFTENLKVE